jgi:hypothetical protein
VAGDAEAAVDEGREFPAEFEDAQAVHGWHGPRWGMPGGSGCQRGVRFV